MTDEFKCSPIDQVKDHIMQETAKQAMKYQEKSSHYVVSGVLCESDGRRVELIDKREYYRALDQKQRAEELLEVAHDEIRKLLTIINYLEAKNGQGTTATEGAVQMGSGPSLPSQER
jgi:hypothetical protein